MTPERNERLLTALNQRQPDLTVVLENVEDPHNISAVIRTADSVGIQDIYVLTTRIPRHKNYGHRSSSSAKKWVTIHEFDNTEECVDALRKKYDRILTTHLSSDAISLYDIDFKGSIALVFGSERFGVSEEMRKLADGNFIIPQLGVIRSLNISVACAVTIYEAMRQKQLAGHYKESRMPGEQYDTLWQEWGFKAEDMKEEDMDK